MALTITPGTRSSAQCVAEYSMVEVSGVVYRHRWDDGTLQTCIYNGISGIDESLDLEKILRGNDSIYSLLS